MEVKGFESLGSDRMKRDYLGWVVSNGINYSKERTVDPLSKTNETLMHRIKCMETCMDYKKKRSGESLCYHTNSEAASTRSVHRKEYSSHGFVFICV